MIACQVQVQVQVQGLVEVLVLVLVRVAVLVQVRALPVWIAAPGRFMDYAGQISLRLYAGRGIWRTVAAIAEGANRRTRAEKADKFSLARTEGGEASAWCEMLAALASRPSGRSESPRVHGYWDQDCSTRTCTCTCTCTRTRTRTWTRTRTRTLTRGAPELPQNPAAPPRGQRVRITAEKYMLARLGA